MTLQKGITSDRFTNPLAPTYTLPGSKEVRENDVYGGSSMSKAWIAERKAVALAQSKSAAEVKTVPKSNTNAGTRPLTAAVVASHVEVGKIAPSDHGSQQAPGSVKGSVQGSQKGSQRAQTAAVGGRLSNNGSKKQDSQNGNQVGEQVENASQKSSGSNFQKNSVNFYDMAKPGPGERPFAIHKPSMKEVQDSKGFSVLNQNRLKEHVSLI